jgi:hypothetical protein
VVYERYWLGIDVESAVLPLFLERRGRTTVAYFAPLLKLFKGHGINPVFPHCGCENV